MLAPEVIAEFHRPGTTIPMVDKKERMVVVEAIEAIKCWQEGVIRNAADANVGSILAIGLPGWTGGVIQFVNNYPGGLEGFIARARDLASKYCERFAPPPLLLEKAKLGELFE